MLGRVRKWLPRVGPVRVRPRLPRNESNGERLSARQNAVRSLAEVPAERFGLFMGDAAAVPLHAKSALVKLSPSLAVRACD